MEMVVVVLVVAVLVSIAMPSYRWVMTRVKNREAVIAMRTIGCGIELYNLENGPLPEEKSNKFDMLDVTVQNSKNWEYHFHCYDEFKSCFVRANSIREMQEGDHKYDLQLWIRKGVMGPEIKVKEKTLVSVEQDENGEEIGSTWTSGEASESVCKQAGGKYIELTDGQVCILE